MYCKLHLRSERAWNSCLVENWYTRQHSTLLVWHGVHQPSLICSSVWKGTWTHDLLTRGKRVQLTEARLLSNAQIQKLSGYIRVRHDTHHIKHELNFTLHGVLAVMGIGMENATFPQFDVKQCAQNKSNMIYNKHILYRALHSNAAFSGSSEDLPLINLFSLCLWVWPCAKSPAHNSTSSGV